MPFGCWWFLNNPSIVEEITRERLEMLGTSFIPQHSDARVLEQVIYKWRNTRRTMAPILANAYHLLSEDGRPVTRARNPARNRAAVPRELRNVHRAAAIVTTAASLLADLPLAAIACKASFSVSGDLSYMALDAGADSLLLQAGGETGAHGLSGIVWQDAARQKYLYRFGSKDHDNIRIFAEKIDRSFLPRPQRELPAIAAGNRHPEISLPAVFEAFGDILRRTGKNVSIHGPALGHARDDHQRRDRAAGRLESNRRGAHRGQHRAPVPYRVVGGDPGWLSQWLHRRGRSFHRQWP